MRSLLAIIIVTGAWSGVVRAEGFGTALPPQPLVEALEAFARATGYQLIYRAELARGLSTKGAQAGLPAVETLHQLLRDTGLEFSFVNARTIAIFKSTENTTHHPVPRDSGVLPDQTERATSGAEGANGAQSDNTGDTSRGDKNMTHRGLLAQIAGIFTACGSVFVSGNACGQEAATTAQTAKSADEELQEIVVTGTSIRGVAPTGSELNVVSLEDIRSTTATTSTELLRSVPQMNDFSATGPNVGNNQANFVDQPAIHGIGVGNGGAGLTLVLLDGNRLPGAGINQAAPDAGVIPVSALQRVEILADGGSSVYGSDAVAGVINFITRRDFNGAETNARDGFADGYKTYNFSQLLGKTWAGGSILLDYEYSGNSHLNGVDRSYAVSDQVPYGGPDTRSNICSPANVTANGTTFGLSPAGPVAGATNLCEANRANDLYPAQYRNQVYGSLHQDVVDGIDVFGNFLFSDRNLSDRVAGSSLTTGGTSVTVPGTSPYYIALPGVPAGTPESVAYSPAADFGPFFTNTVHTQTLSAILGTNFKLGTWNGELILNDGVERDDVREFGINQTAATNFAADGTFNPYGVGAANNPGVLQTVGNFETRYYVKQTIKDGQLKFDGPVFDIWGGTIRAAVGADVRQESFDGQTATGPEASNGLPSTGIGSTPLVIADSSRNIDSAYAEVHVPMVGENNAIAGVRRLDISVAGRYDHYNDFGSTTNPKVGINWTVFDGLTFRGSAGSSFHAPSLADSPTAIDTRAINFACSPGFIGCAGAPPGAYGVVLAGGNKLKPEEADTYNFGVDFAPKFLDGFVANLTYFRVNYKDVITFPTFAPVTNPLAAYDQYRTVRPAGISDAEWAAEITPILGAFRDQGLIYPTNPLLPVAIYDLRRQNFANELINGADYNFTYHFDTDIGHWQAGIAGTQIMTFYQKIPGVSQIVQLAGTDYAPHTRFRGTLGWNQTQYGAFLFVNYVGTYTNENFTPYQSVSSFTTLDLHLSWSPPLTGFLEKTQFVFDVTNLLDRAPPVYFTNNSNNGIPGFDPTVANAFGRIVTVGLHKSW